MLDIFEFIARVLTQIPEPRKRGIHYFGAYSSKARAFRAKTKLTLQSIAPNIPSPLRMSLYSHLKSAPL